MNNKNVRKVALTLLERIEKEGSFSHLLLSKAMQREQLNELDEKLLTEIIYGTMERKLTLDFYLDPFIQSSKKVADWVMILLRMSVFQLRFLDKIPEYAIIHEAVEIAKQKGHKGIASFVNGVLRNIQRKGVQDTDTIADPIEKLAIETSHPKWLVKRWMSYYGFDVTKQMCEANITRKPISVRVNRLRTDRKKIIQLLEKKGILAEISPYVKDGILIRKGNILKTNVIMEGLVTVQDQSSMLAGELLNVEPSMQVLDACSAPGGKATYLGELMENRGTIFAYDLHPNKINLVKENANRLGLTLMEVGQSDARKLQQIHQKETFDRILVDAPCSGLGVIRSKPDIKYSKNIEDIKKLHQVQLNILNHVAPLVKNSGKIVYSTCTVEMLENENVVQEFLENQSNYQVDKTFFSEVEKFAQNAQVTKYGLQLFPYSIQSDGFFITRLQKKQ